MKPTTDYLEERALDTCDPVAATFAVLVEEDHVNTQMSPTVHGATRAPVNGAKHFVALVAAEDVADVEATEGYVIVDGTIQQFEEKLEQSLPDVAIVPPNDDRRAWYDSIHQ